MAENVKNELEKIVNKLKSAMKCTKRKKEICRRKKGRKGVRYECDELTGKCIIRNDAHMYRLKHDITKSLHNLNQKIDLLLQGDILETSYGPFNVSEWSNINEDVQDYSDKLHRTGYPRPPTNDDLDEDEMDDFIQSLGSNALGSGSNKCWWE